MDRLSPAREGALGRRPRRRRTTPLANAARRRHRRSSRSSTAKTNYDPVQLANGAVELLNEVSQSKITGEEERYSHTDLDDFKANIDGAQEAFDLLKPALEETDPELVKEIDQRFADMYAALEAVQGRRRGLRELRRT